MFYEFYPIGNTTNNNNNDETDDDDKAVLKEIDPNKTLIMEQLEIGQDNCQPNWIISL